MSFQVSCFPVRTSTQLQTVVNAAERRRTEVWPCYPAATAKRLHWMRVPVPARITYIQAVFSDVQMSQRPSTAVSVWTTPASHWPWVKAKAAIVIKFLTGCVVHATIHYWRPRLYRRCASRMEQSAWLTAPTIIIGTIQETWKLIYLKSHLRNMTVCDLKAACVAYSAIISYVN